MAENVLYYGDNLDILRRCFKNAARAKEKVANTESGL
jgi:hypothetical protein